MKPSNLRHPSMTRDQVLVAHAAEMIARTSFSTPRFAEALAGQLQALAPMRAADAGVPDFAALAAAGDSTPFLRASAAWLKRVQRWLDGEVDLPSWLEEAWVQALEPEYRERCLAELAQRHGLLAVRPQDGAGVTAATVFGQLIARLGHAVEQGSEVLADGQIDLQDLPLLPALIEQLLAVESRACELRRFAENVRDGGPLRVVAG